jgi:hypothetical protein
MDLLRKWILMMESLLAPARWYFVCCDHCVFNCHFVGRGAMQPVPVLLYEQEDAAATHQYGGVKRCIKISARNRSTFWSVRYLTSTIRTRTDVWTFWKSTLIYKQGIGFYFYNCICLSICWFSETISVPNAFSFVDFGTVIANAVVL